MAFTLKSLKFRIVKNIKTLLNIKKNKNVKFCKFSKPNDKPKIVIKQLPTNLPKVVATIIINPELTDPILMLEGTIFANKDEPIYSSKLEQMNNIV